MLLGHPVGSYLGEAGFFQAADKLLLRIYGKTVDEGKPLPVPLIQTIRFIHDQEGPLWLEDPEDLPEALDRTWPEIDSLEGTNQIERSCLQRQIRDVALKDAAAHIRSVFETASCE